jgi:hypothetical protein
MLTANLYDAHQARAEGHYRDDQVQTWLAEASPDELAEQLLSAIENRDSMKRVLRSQLIAALMDAEVYP